MTNIPITLKYNIKKEIKKYLRQDIGLEDEEYAEEIYKGLYKIYLNNPEYSEYIKNKRHIKKIILRYLDILRW